MIVELSKYDLVRKDAPQLTLGGVSPISELQVEALKPARYAFLLENPGLKEQTIAFGVRLLPSDQEIPFTPPSNEPLQASERRRYTVTLPAQEPGDYRLRIVVSDASDPSKLLARKTVRVKVLPKARSPQ
jgi:hypothetical protein